MAGVTVSTLSLTCSAANQSARRSEGCKDVVLVRLNAPELSRHSSRAFMLQPSQLARGSHQFVNLPFPHLWALQKRLRPSSVRVSYRQAPWMEVRAYTGSGRIQCMGWKKGRREVIMCGGSRRVVRKQKAPDVRRLFTVSTWWYITCRLSSRSASAGDKTVRRFR